MVARERRRARRSRAWSRTTRPLTWPCSSTPASRWPTSTACTSSTPCCSSCGRLPEGTRYAVWTTGDRPTKVVDSRRRRAAAAQGPEARRSRTGGNTLLDALVEASRDLQKKEGERARDGGGDRHRDRVQRTATGSRWWTSVQANGRDRLAVAVRRERRRGHAGAGRGRAGSTTTTCSRARWRRHGRRPRDASLSAMGVGTRARQASRASSRAQYRLSYASAAGLKARTQARGEGGPARSQGPDRRPALERASPARAGRRRAAGALALLPALPRCPAPQQRHRRADAAPADVRDRDRGHQPQRLRHRRAQSRYVTDLDEARLRRLRGRRAAGALALHPRGPARSRSSLHDRHLGLDGREAARRRRRPPSASSRPCGPQDNAQVDAVQRPHHDRCRTSRADHAPLESAITRTEASGPTALHNALYVALKELSKQKKAGELRRRAIVLLSDGEDTASLVSDEQVLELARKTEINIYAISLRPNRVAGPQPAEVQPGRAPADRAHPRDGRAGALPQLALRARRGLRPHRRGAAHAVQPRLRLVEQAPRRQVAPHRGAHARRARSLQVRHKLGYYAVATTTTSR